MERTVSIEERIRKAEEIYYKRKNPGVKIETERNSYYDEKNKNSNSFIKRKMKKLFLQIGVCIVLYVILYSTDFGTTIFKEDTSNYIKTFLAIDIDLNKLYQDFNNYMQSISPNEQNDKQENSINTNNVGGETENSINTNEIEQTQKNEGELLNIEGQTELMQPPEIPETTVAPQDTESIPNSEENIGGAVEVEETNNESLDPQIDEENNTSQNKTEAELNSEYILSKVNFIKPLENYEITSRYGLRNPTTSTVPKNHTGIDLAAERGTKIVSATNGTVILASSQGDFGNHLKIQIDDVIIVYAHCEKLYVEEGQEIVQGQEIAEVGSSGNSTGPHLHFEIRLNDKVIDPEYILDFS